MGSVEPVGPGGQRSAEPAQPGGARRPAAGRSGVAPLGHVVVVDLHDRGVQERGGLHRAGPGELLVVVIVIAILVTLGGIGWRTANNNAINSQTSTDLRIIKNAIERYAKDNGEYPFPSGCSGAVGMVAICNNGELTNLLVPRYLEKMPKNHKNRDYPYAVIVKKSTSDPTPGYGLAAEKAEGGECKSGKNMIAGWFGNAPECKF